MHILSKNQSNAKNQSLEIIAALVIFACISGALYLFNGIDWHCYGQQDWDYSEFMHAVGVWTLKYFHQFPLWNPYLLGGSSLIGNPQDPGIFSLSFLTCWLTDPVLGLKWADAINAFVGMLGMYFFLEYLKANWVGRVLGAVLVVMNGDVLYHTFQGHFMWLMAMYWPWMFLFLLKGLQKRSWIYLAALFLSLQFWGGGPYQVTFACILSGAFILFLSLKDKRPMYLGRWIQMMAFFVIFTAPKLLMMLETSYHYPRVTLGQDTQVPWSILYHAFLVPDQMHEAVAGLSIREYSSYIGIVPLLLALYLFITQGRAYWPWLAALIITLALGMGNAPYLPFWPILHHLAGGYVHYSTRCFLMSNFILAIAAGLGLSYLIMRYQARWSWMPWLGLMVLIGVFINQWMVLDPLKQCMHTKQGLYEPFEPQADFSQIQKTQAERYLFGNSSMMADLLKNTGVANGYDALPILSYVHPANASNYPGEYFLRQGLGQVHLVSWSPNRWRFQTHMVGQDVLVINQNYDPGWHTSPSRQTMSVDGLFGIVLNSGDRQIQVQYLPFNFFLGLVLSLIGLVLMVIDLRLFYA